MKAVLALVVAATAVAHADRDDDDHLHQALVSQTAAADQLGALLADEVVVGPLLFADAACQRRFGGPVVVRGSDRAQLAVCVTSRRPGIVTQLSPQAWQADGALFWFTFARHRIVGIGPYASSRFPTLFTYKIDSLSQFTPSQAVKATRDGTTAWFVTCSDGKAPATTRFLVGSGDPDFDREATAYVAQAVFPAAAQMFDGRLVAACVIWPVFDARPPSREGVSIVPPGALEALRIAGDKVIEPDDATKKQIAADGRDKFVGAFKLCNALDGAISSVVVLKSTGFPAYDHKILTTIRDTWKYQPFLIDGKPAPVCTAVTFIYSAR